MEDDKSSRTLHAGHSHLSLSQLQQKSFLLSNKKKTLLSGPSPIENFGRWGALRRSSATVNVFDPATQKLTWYILPASVLVIKKLGKEHILRFVELIKWLIVEKEKIVYVESFTFDHTDIYNNPEFTDIIDKLKIFVPGEYDLSDKVDFIICVGGDGTLLHASSLFKKSVPPVMAFNMGSMGFLTPFSFGSYRECLTHVFETNPFLVLRSRLKCTLLKKDNIASLVSYSVLNEVVIDRGVSPYLSHIDLFMQGKYITSMQGDGLIVSTPTGSTAYAGSAGGSLVHPSVPSVLVTPICPHSLSFRPLVIPAGVELEITVTPNNRSSGISFDGRNRQEFRDGDRLQIRVSRYPLPSVCSQDQLSDWTTSLAECLHWNVRKKQKPLDAPEQPISMCTCLATM